MRRWSLLVLSSVVLGILLGIAIVRVPQSSLTGSVQHALLPEDLVRCAYEVDRKHWTQYQNTAFGFELWFPSTFVMREEQGDLVLGPVTGELPVIRFVKLRERLSSASAGSPFQFAGYKVQDRQSLVLSSPYFSKDIHTVTSTYLFVRDFQLQGANVPLVIVRADIEDSGLNPVFSQAREQKISDVESVLTQAEQILSTFRFLTYSELYGT